MNSQASRLGEMPYPYRMSLSTCLMHSRVCAASIASGRRRLPCKLCNGVRERSITLRGPGLSHHDKLAILVGMPRTQEYHFERDEGCGVTRSALVSTFAWLASLQDARQLRLRATQPTSMLCLHGRDLVE